MTTSATVDGFVTKVPAKSTHQPWSTAAVKKHPYAALSHVTPIQARAKSLTARTESPVTMATFVPKVTVAKMVNAQPEKQTPVDAKPMKIARDSMMATRVMASGHARKVHALSMKRPCSVTQTVTQCVTM